jgi:hypothetical protein
MDTIIFNLIDNSVNNRYAPGVAVLPGSRLAQYFLELKIEEILRVHRLDNNRCVCTSPGAGYGNNILVQHRIEPEW